MHSTVLIDSAGLFGRTPSDSSNQWQVYVIVQHVLQCGAAALSTYCVLTHLDMLMIEEQ